MAGVREAVYGGAAQGLDRPSARRSPHLITTAQPEILHYKETPKQRQFAAAVFSGKYRYLFYGGAIRGGKSYCIMAIIFMLCWLFPGSRWAIVRKDMPTIERNLYPVFYKLKPWFCGKINGRTHTATCTNGSQIIFFPESFDTDKEYERWRGLEVNGFWLEEANELVETSWNWAIQRAGSWVIQATPENPEPRQPLPYILLTSNPAGNWVKRMFYTPWKNKTLQAPFFYIPATAHDNPYLPKAYLESLELLPTRDYKVFVLGDWDLLVGAALEELSDKVHLVPRGKFPRSIPRHWFRFGGFDWGFAHPFSFGTYFVTPDGQIVKRETVTGKGLNDNQMIQYILEATAASEIVATDVSYVAAGPDAFNEEHAKEATGQTTAERFQRAQIPMMKADPARISGLKNFRELVAWQKRKIITIDGQKVGTPGEPRFVWIDTPANRRCFEQCQAMVLDPDRPEDVKKVDAVEGEGGDDEFDETRYALQSRAEPAQEPQAEVPEDVHPGFDYKKRVRKPRGPAPGVLAGQEEPEDDDLRPNFRFRPQPGFTRMPRWGGGNGPRDDEEDDR